MNWYKNLKQTDRLAIKGFLMLLLSATNIGVVFSLYNNDIKYFLIGMFGSLAVFNFLATAVYFYMACD